MANQPTPPMQPGQPAQPGMGQPAQPAQPSGKGPQSSQTKLFQQLLAGLLQWMWGKGMPDIQRQLQGANNNTLPVVIGHIAFALVQEGVDQGEKAGQTFDTEMLMGVATEVIESLTKMAAGMNMQFNAKALSLRALVQVLSDYADTLPPGSDAQQQAKEAIQELGQGGMQQGADALKQIGAENGVDPFAGQGQGQGQPAPPNQPPAPSQQGLMGAQNNA
jgi:hypothetical protein